MTERLDPDGIARKIAGFGLCDDSSAPAIGEKDWRHVLGRLRNQHITGLAVAGVEAGWLSLSTEQTDELLDAHRQAMLVPLAVERALLDVSTELDAKGVEFVVLKGPSLAHTVYPDPSWRYFGDLDLMVRAEDWRTACRILESLGYRRNLPEPRGGFDKRFGKAAEFRREGGVEVDLHRTLVVGPFGLWIEPAALFEGTTELRLWGRTFRRLDDTVLQLHACMHASLGWWPLLRVPVRDVAQVAHCAEVDWEALDRKAARWKLRAVVRYALEAASKTLEIDFPPEARRVMTQTPSRQEVRALQGYLAGRRSPVAHEISTLRAIPGLAAKAAYVRALMFPSQEFLAARSGSIRPSYLTRWLKPIRWQLRRWWTRGLRPR